MEGLMCGRLQDIKKWILKKLEGVDWIDVALDRAALSTVTNLNLPQNAVDFLNSSEVAVFSLTILFRGVSN